MADSKNVSKIEEEIDSVISLLKDLLVLELRKEGKNEAEMEKKRR